MSNKFLIGAGIAGIVIVALPILFGALDDILIRTGVVEDDTPEPEKADDEKYLVITGEDHLPEYFQKIGLLPKGDDLENVKIAEKVAQIEEEYLTDAIVLAERQPPLWVASKAKHVTIVSLNLPPKTPRGSIPLEQIEKIATDPETYEAQRKEG